ncbi:hypothetical protein [Sphingomonas sp. BK481]|uniref:hypothetical protein n=1 Tax=Sphingomonas sp. BK481 TaxID=2586981 RepID=UPI0017E38891|nr:hypothetical protein [Sphingomonas sp. BK481]MBB3588933.1 hypothetical protein [Sphingomonas sp. BK481]
MKEALLYMAKSGAFPDDLALSRWAITDEAEPHLRYWLAEGRRPLPAKSEDIDLEAAKADVTAQDVLAADIAARFTPEPTSIYNPQTVTDMFHSGWFGQGPAFWRWVETDAAQPYIAACAAMRRAPTPGELADVMTPDPTTQAIEDPDFLAALAASIEATFGRPDEMTTSAVASSRDRLWN